MKIKLIPNSHPVLDDIEINDDVFFIGRLEEPFMSYDADISADISRRHAKVFVESGQVSIVDLESLNGTTVNQLPLEKEAVALNNGDVIEFAGHLSYRIEFDTPDLDATVLANLQQEVRLILEPVDKTAGLDVLVVTGFPFLISKEAGIFASFNKDFATQTSQISRRHAYVVLEKNELKLIDMSSTNGTMINGTMVEESHPVTLKNADIISFAGDFFVYTVKLDAANPANDQTVLKPQSVKIHLEQNEDKTEQESPVNDIEPKTTFVNEPSPFLDILCEEQDSNPVKKQDVKEKQNAEINDNMKQKKSIFIVSFIRQCKAALTDEPPKKGRKKRYGVLLGLICISAAAGYYYLNDETRATKKLLKAGQYADATILAEKLVNTKPENEEFKTLYVRAKLNGFVPDWQKMLTTAQYTEAKKHLEQANISSSGVEQLSNAIEILQWVADMHQFSAARKSNNGIMIFKDEEKIESLLAYWKNKLKQNKTNLAMIARNVTSFKPNYEQVLSEVRLLEDDKNLYLKAIETLKTDIIEQLKTAQTDSLNTTVTEFEKKYSAVLGLDDLKQDVYQMAVLIEAVKNRKIENTALHKRIELKTPLFVDYYQNHFVDQVPSEQFTQQYFAAIDSWKIGNYEIAINKLQALSNSRWADVADKKREQYQLILNAFLKLEAVKGSEAYVESLFNFHGMLKLPEDDYFFKMIEKDFQDNELLAREKSENSFNQAQIFWEKYNDSRGIGGILRLEQSVSKNFKAQANNLSQALHNILYSTQIYNSLKISPPQNVNQLASAIKKEMTKQRKWLIDLELILKPDTLQKKLDLLVLVEGQ